MKYFKNCHLNAPLTHSHTYKKELNEGKQFSSARKNYKKRIAKFKTTNAFCKYNCFVQKNQTV